MAHINLISLVESIVKAGESIKPITVNKNILAEGIRISRQVLLQPEDISLTPYMKNGLLQLDNKHYLNVGDSETKIEKFVTEETRKLLVKYCGNRNVTYNTKLDPGDKRHYFVDCGRNFKEGTNLRHVIPNMSEKRKKAVNVFTKPIPFNGKFIRGASNSKISREVINTILKGTPEITSSSKWTEVNAPFMNKHTNVGYPYFRNDRMLVPGTKQTFAQLCSEVAKTKSAREVANYPFILFGRNLRQKARVIFGGSRIQALVYNQVESVRIQSDKESNPMFIGYNDDVVMKSKMIKLGEYLMNNRHLTVLNRDFSAFDSTVSPMLIALIGSMELSKVRDARGMDLITGMTASSHKTKLITGYSSKMMDIYGRILSGELKTNNKGGKIGGYASAESTMQQGPDGAKVFNECAMIGTSSLGDMGDDTLSVQPKDFNNEQFTDYLFKTFGLESSHEKGEYGLFFLQRRLFYSNGKWTYITPFTRIIRSMFSKEMRKGLGPAGGTIASYMLLDQLKEGPELMIDVAKIFFKFDQYKLGLQGTVSELKRRVADEDRQASIDDPKRSLKTVDKLYDGDPLKESLFNDKGDADDDFLGNIHKVLSKALL